jgi:hypothetical protein
MSAGPSPDLINHRIPTRLSFIKGSERVEYSYVEFRPVRTGTQEIELVSVSKQLPFDLSVVIPRHFPTTRPLNFRVKNVGAEVHEIKKFLDGFNLLQEGGEIELFNLEHNAVIMRVPVDLPPDELDAGLASL